MTQIGATLAGMMGITLPGAPAQGTKEAGDNPFAALVAGLSLPASGGEVDSTAALVGGLSQDGEATGEGKGEGDAKDEAEGEIALVVDPAVMPAAMAPLIPLPAPVAVAPQPVALPVDPVRVAANGAAPIAVDVARAARMLSALVMSEPGKVATESEAGIAQDAKTVPLMGEPLPTQKAATALAMPPVDRPVMRERRWLTDMPQAETAVADKPAADSSESIMHGLPPIIQSRIEGAPMTVAAPVTAPFADIQAAATRPLDTAAALQGQVIDMGVGGQWIDRMAQEIATLADGSGHSRFQLAPAHLGRIQVDMWQGDDGARVQMLTETDEAARRLRDGQPMLQADARVASLSLNQISIERAPGNLDSARDQAGQQGQRHQFNDPAGQSGGQGQNSAAQHKAPARRDVLNERAAPAPRDAEASVGRRGGRLVRYA